MLVVRIALALLGVVGLLAGAVGAVVLVVRAFRDEALPRNGIAIVVALVLLSVVVVVGSGVRVVSNLSRGPGEAQDSEGSE